MSEQYVQVITAIVAGVLIASIQLRQFRLRRLSFSLLLGWVGVATLIGFGPLIGIIVSDSTRRVGISPTGFLLGVVVLISFVMFHRLSVEQSFNRRCLLAFVANSPSDLRAPGTSSTTLIVVPALNERAAISSTVRDIIDMGYACLVVDDGSADDTATLARSAGAAVVSHPVNVGVGAALRTGISIGLKVGYTRFIQCDADGQHTPAEIPLVEGLLNDGVDLAIGTRWAGAADYGGSVSRLRRLTMRMMAGYGSRVAGVRLTDVTSGFRGFSPRLARAASTQLGDEYLADTFECVIRAGRGSFVIREVPTVMRARTGGLPSTGGTRLVSAALRSIAVAVLRLHPPFRESA